MHFLTSSIVAASIESQASALEDSLGRRVIVTSSDASFDSSASVDEDVLNFTNNMSEVASVQTFVTDVDRSGITELLQQGEDLIQSLCEQRSDSFLVRT